MKIILDDRAYIQLNDIAYIFNNLEEMPVPAALFDVIFNQGQPFICTDDNRYKFVEFKDSEVIQFFKNFPYSVDYLTLKDKSEEEIIQIGREIAIMRNELAKEFNEMSYQDKIKNQSLVSECELLEFKLLSIRDILWIKQGRLKIKIPKINSNKKIFNKLTNLFKFDVKGKKY